MTTKLVNQSKPVIEGHRWGRFDSKGREIGMNVITYQAEYAQQDEGKTYGYGFEPGCYYVACCQASRNGENYGATQGAHHCRSIEERDEYIRRRLSDSKKKAARG